MDSTTGAEDTLAYSRWHSHTRGAATREDMETTKVTICTEDLTTERRMQAEPFPHSKGRAYGNRWIERGETRGERTIGWDQGSTARQTEGREAAKPWEGEDDKVGCGKGVGNGKGRVATAACTVSPRREYYKITRKCPQVPASARKYQKYLKYTERTDLLK